MLRTISILLLLALAAVPLSAASGDTVVALKDYIFGPVMYLVIACGILASLYMWIRRQKQAALFIFVAMVFIAYARQTIPLFFGSTGNAGFAMSLGDFPIYGQSPSVQVPGELQAYDDIRSWGYVGLVCCKEITDLLFRLGVPIMVASVGAMVTYYRISVKHQAGSMITYIVTIVMVGAFCVFPTVSFVSPDAARIQQNDVIKSVTALNANLPPDTIADGGNMAIPVLPALILVGGVDFTEAIGNAINKNPRSSYPTMMLRSARNSQLPDGWFGQYKEFSVQCAAAQKGFADAEKGNSDAIYTSGRWAEGVLQRVNGSSLNLFSRWGDNLLAWIPVHGYTVNDAVDMSTIRSVERYGTTEKKNDLSKASQNWKWIRSDIEEEAKLSAMIDQSYINSGLPAEDQFRPLPILQTPDGIPIWTRPNGLASLVTPKFSKSPGNTWAVPYCSVPLAGNNASGFAPYFDLEVNRSDGANGAVSGFSFYGNGVTNESQYLKEIAQAVATPASAGQSYTVRIAPVDWGEQLRSELLGQYTPAYCTTACGNPSHKYFWGCMVSGSFLQINTVNPGSCESSAKTTQAFYGQTVDGGAYPNYSASIHGNLYGLTAATKPRDLGTLSTSVLAGQDVLTWPTAARRAAVDLIMAAPGNYTQNKLARDAFSPPKQEEISLWHILEMLPKAAMWLLAIFAEVAAMLISFLWPHFMGITLMLFLIVYPIFGMIALWPSKWTILLDWARGGLWVLMWAPVVTLGYAFINSGSYLTQEASFLSSMPGPGQAVLTLVGACLILMAPAVAQAVLSPSFSSLAKLGGAVYGTGFKIIGAAVQIGVSIAAAGFGTMAAGVTGGKASKDAANDKNGESKPSDQKGDKPAGSDKQSGDSKQGIVGRMASAGKAGLQAGRRANQMASAALAGADLLGAQGLSSGASVGGGAADGIYSSTAAAGVTAFAGGRMAARTIANRSASNGTATSETALGRIAQDIAGPTGGAFAGSSIASLIDGGRGGIFASSGDATAQAQFARGNIAAHADKFNSAMQRGDIPTALNSAHATSTFQQARAQALAAKGDFTGAGEALKGFADAESFIARHGDQHDYDRSSGAHRQAMGVAKDLERHGIATGNKGMVQASRRMQADLRSSEAGTIMAQADFLQANGHALAKDAEAATGPERHALLRESASNFQQAGALRQRARVGAQEAMQGYGAAHQHLKDEMVAAAPRASMDDEGALRSMAGYATGLSSLGVQAKQLHERTGVEVPKQISLEGLSADLGQAGAKAGPVGAAILSAIIASSGGNVAGASEHLVVAAQSARGRGLSRSYVTSIESMASTLAAEGEGNVSPVDRQVRFMRQVGGNPSIGEEQEGFRHFDGLAVMKPATVEVPGAKKTEIVVPGS